MDLTVIRGLRVATTIGVHPWERAITQELKVDLELGHDAHAAGQSDDLADALDYEAVAACLAQAGAASRFRLVEAFAEHLAGLLLQRFGLRHLRLCVWKPGALGAAEAVGIVIERSRPC